MSTLVKEQQEIDVIVKDILADFDGRKNIDAVDIFNKPDKREVQELVKNLFKIVYPGYFRDKSFKIYNPSNSYAVIIEDTFYHMNKQVFLALDFCKKRGTMTEDDRRKESYRICKAFFGRIPKIREYIESDLLAAYDGDPAAGCFEEIILAYPGLIASTVYRIAHELYVEQVPVLPRMMTELAHSKTGIDIHPGATIDKNFFIDHGTGIVIGETAIIGKNVKIYQGVTIGALSTRGGQKLSGKKRHPTICDNVTIYAGASILGGNTIIGENAVIGGNTFITSSINPNTIVSMKNLEMEYRTSENTIATEELHQSEEWYYII
ncbi:MULTISPECIES: serine O-acetyltransferase EpsC [Pseudobutyrivibrio]|uniref:Serine O-acetyltransferase n=1 Tax=Pseudobutyrivibrio xylanivorans DSM 14809 TaxID=1123012 RepID=A0A1M6AGQ7_PSEXY|nr:MULTISPECIES: serine O-acetyltransferase EpsC [Pseudobutyrivibrio]SFN65013.1 serine O-acetyltransferase [Pseudobutyrivibrio sp. UC1225]SHI35498.1 serine O-acetyltransferase [Pseudobutyrivibrio xylanivorans DSM 14809]